MNALRTMNNLNVMKVLNNLRDWNHTEHFYKKAGMTTGGVLLCGVGVGFLKLAAFGVDPFQSFMAGLNAFIPIPFGTLHIIVSICLLTFMLAFDRHYIGLGTIVNLFLLGYVIDYSTELLQALFPAPVFTVRVLAFFIGIGIMCISSSFYFTADMGVSPYDAVALILANKWHIGTFKYVRICTDLVCISLGCTLYLVSGGSLKSLTAIAGFGTIITAFFMGSLIEFFNQTLAQPFLNGQLTWRRNSSKRNMSHRIRIVLYSRSYASRF